MTLEEEQAAGLVRAPCPERCDARDARASCQVCEGEGFVLRPLVPTASATPTQDTESDARPDTEGAVEGSGEDAQQERAASTSFGGLSPSEAASLRWEQERARQAEQESVTAGEDIVVRTTVPVSTIIKRLSKDAQGGSHQAARELRAWLSDVVVETSTSLSELDERTRQSMVARLLREIEQEESDGQTDGMVGSRHASSPVEHVAEGHPR